MKNIQSLQISFYLNDQAVTLDIKPEERAIDIIRNQLGLTGTKEVCSEGDCGACTIAMGRWEEDRFIYRAVTSCILAAARLHGTHVITTEGLVAGDKLHLIQQMMLNHHAIQCGYCSPGIVMSLFCLFSDKPQPNKEEILAALEGNLCRCTGYTAIYDATDAVIEQLQKNAAKWQEMIFPAYTKDIAAKLKPTKAIKLTTQNTDDVDVAEAYFVPTTLSELFTLMEQHEDTFELLCGGTDFILDANAKGFPCATLIDLSQIKALNFINKTDNSIKIGAITTYSQLLENKLIQQYIPALGDVIRLMASKQIRNIASIGGNIGSAAPIADGACALLGLGAILTLKSNQKERKVPLEDFYKDYRITELHKNEIISSIEIPIPNGKCSFIKGSKRLAVDISKICSFMNIAIQDNKITHCRIAFGGTEKYPALAKNVMHNIAGKDATAELMQKLPEMVLNEFESYISKRSEPEYRRLLIKNQMQQHINQCVGEKNA